MKRTVRLILPLVIVAVTMLACRGVEGPTAPVDANGLASPVGATLSRSGDHEDTLRTLRRTHAVDRVVAAKTIGPAGGEIVLATTGARAIFPPGAVPKATLITMTARAGTDVVYDFQPHMTFAIPVVIQQELAGTNALGNQKVLGSLAGGYFDGEYDANVTDAKRKFVRCREVLPGIVEPGGRRFSFLVFHFSGYLASSGRAGKDGDQ